MVEASRVGDVTSASQAWMRWRHAPDVVQRQVEHARVGFDDDAGNLLGVVFGNRHYQPLVIALLGDRERRNTAGL